MTQTSLGRTRSIRVAIPEISIGIALGTGVLTTEGELPVEYLMPGDRVLTYDRGALPLSQLIVRDVQRSEVLAIRPGMVDPQDEAPEVVMAARSRIVLRDWRAQAMFGKRAVLVAADRLVDGAHIARLDGPGKVRLFQIVFDDGEHLVQIAGGRFQVASAKLPAPLRA